MDKVTNKGIIKGRSDTYIIQSNAGDPTRILDLLFEKIDKHTKLSNQAKADIKNEFQEIQAELRNNNKADEDFIMRRLRNIGRMAPDILEVILATIVHPALGFGIVAKKIAEKAKQI